MTQEEIQEYNKMCAEFIGFYYRDENTVQPIHNWITGLATMTYDPIRFLKFESDWNWIMEVIEKIEGLQKYEVKITKPLNTKFHYCEIRWIKTESSYMIITVGNDKTKKEAVLQAINQFLIWYNENNK
jgi:hypothetical protein